MRSLISGLAIVLAIIVQLTVMDRLSLPGGTGPNVVLIAVAAFALAEGPLAGSLIGFVAGLALDVAPPGSYLVGQDALVFCLVGYACGLAAATDGPDGEHTALYEIIVTGIGAICGEALQALLGVMLSDPRVTWPAIRHVLPAAVVYDLLLAPFVLYAVAALLRLAGARGKRAAFGTGLSLSPAAGSGSSGAIRSAGGGNTPRLRLSGKGGHGTGWLAGTHGGSAASPPGSKREPKLKLGHSGSLTAGLFGAAFSPGTTRRGQAFSPGGLAGGPKVRFGSRRHEGVLGGSLLGGSLFSSSRGRGALGGGTLGGSKSPFLGGSRFGGMFGGSRSGGLFGRSMFGGAPSAAKPRGRWQSKDRHAPRFRQRSAFGALLAMIRRPAKRRSLGKGWMRGSRRGSMIGGVSKGFGSQRSGSKGLGPKGLGAKSFSSKGIRPRSYGSRGLSGGGVRLGSKSARLRMRRPKAKKNWRTGGYR